MSSDSQNNVSIEGGEERGDCRTYTFNPLGSGAIDVGGNNFQSCALDLTSVLTSKGLVWACSKAFAVELTNRLPCVDKERKVSEK